MSNPGLNSGVQNATGIEFQKNVALYLFLENYENFKKKEFFICIEHHEDFLYCFKNHKGLIYSIETYQAKKASKKWTLNNEFYEILKKILNVGVALAEDKIKKSIDYNQKLYFTSNEYIDLKIKIDDTENQNKKKEIGVKISETNKDVEFQSLESEIKNEIIKKLTKKESDQIVIEKLKELNFLYIDFPKERKNQVDQLIGASTNLFREKIADHAAAIDTLLKLFRNVETFYNQGIKAELLDNRKRVSSEEIFNGIKIITTKQKAYSLWRNEKEKIPEIFELPVSEHNDFENDFNNCFDLFKDQTQVVHNNILTFVKKNKNILNEYYTDSTCINALYSKFKNTNSTLLIDRALKAALFAAYVEVRG